MGKKMKFQVTRNGSDKNSNASSVKRKRDSEECSLFDRDMVLHLIPPIKTTLDKSRAGQSILENYENIGILTSYEQNQLVDIVLKDLSGRTNR